MKLNLDQVFKDRKGNAMKEEGVEVNLGSIAYTAVCAQYADEQSLSRDIKIKRGRLAQKLLQEGDLDWKVEEVAMIKDCIGKGFGPWIVVQSEDMLEGVKETPAAVPTT